MTREEIFEIARTIFGRALKVDSRYARLSLKSAGVGFRRSVVAIEWGPRNFEVDINTYDKRIRVIEVVTTQKLRYDNRNPLNGFALKYTRSERVIGAYTLDQITQEHQKNN